MKAEKSTVGKYSTQKGCFKEMKIYSDNNFVLEELYHVPNFKKFHCDKRYKM